MNTFKEFISTREPAQPLLPAVHITNAFSFNQIIQTNKIQATLCKCYKRNLAYFFYGKPAYKLVRRRDDPPSSKLLGDAAVCFVLNLSKLPPLKRVFPFDTGAYFGKRYTNYIPRNMTIDDFELDAASDAPARLVSGFYGDNNRYYRGDLYKQAGPSKIDFAAEAFENIIRSLYSERLDERATTCELQFDQDIDLNSDVLESIIMPDTLLGDPVVRSAMERWCVSPILYAFLRGTPGERTAVIADKIYDLYKRRDLL